MVLPLLTIKIFRGLAGKPLATKKAYLIYIQANLALTIFEEMVMGIILTLLII